MNPTSVPSASSSLEAVVHVATIEEPRRPTFETAGSPDVAPEKLDLLARHGRHTLSYSLFQPGVQHFVTPLGLIAHEPHLLGKRIVLADPLASAADAPAVLDAFLAQYPRPFFCCIGRETAQLLSERGFYVNEFGKDIRIHLPSYDLSGPKKATLRQAWNKFQREAWTVEELSHGESGAAELAESISREWRATRVVAETELRFLTRPIVHGSERDVRKFFVRNAAGKVVAFYFFDPIYEGGAIVGYSTSFKRRLDEAMTGMEEAVNVWAIEKFRAEGKTWFHLGLIPLYKIDEPPTFRHSSVIRNDLAMAKKLGDKFFFNIQGQADFKHRFRGEEMPIYVATRTLFDPRGIYGMMFATGLKVSARKSAQILYGQCRAKVAGLFNKAARR